MRSTASATPFLLVLALTLFAPGSAAAQPGSTQDVCVGEPTGRDVFSVGELRTSILPQTPFQEINGAEWVLADGRPLLVQTALSPHLSQENEYGLTIPDIRGRFLRMANNNVCANLRGDKEAYDRCIASRDPRGDRILGDYQADGFARFLEQGPSSQLSQVWDRPVLPVLRQFCCPDHAASACPCQR